MNCSKHGLSSKKALLKNIKLWRRKHGFSFWPDVKLSLLIDHDRPLTTCWRVCSQPRQFSGESFSELARSAMLEVVDSGRLTYLSHRTEMVKAVFTQNFDLGLPEENLLNTDSPSYLRCLRVLCGQSSSFLNNNMILCKNKSQDKGVFWRTFVAQEARNCFSSLGKGTTGKLSCTLLW